MCVSVCVCVRERERVLVFEIFDMNPLSMYLPPLKRAMVLYEYVHCPFILQMKKERGKTQKEQKILFVLFVKF